MRTDQSPQQTPTRLKDYLPPAWWVEDVHLTFDLAPSATLVTAQIRFRRNPERADAPFELHGRKLTFRGAKIDGEQVEPEIDEEGLRVTGPLPDSFVWTCETEIDPKANTELEGLYLSNGMYCTQCEAEGFRKITFYPDRPDVMAPFTVRIEGEKSAVPVMLSNGNPVERGELADGRHFAIWRDPWPKPAYLFALVAGELVSHDDSFTTAAGRDVKLQVFVRPGDEGKCAYAMDSLKRSMRWDEEAYGREYDLDLFMIVAVEDFNMGAMENKGLNIFNSKFVLASPETATDRDYELIESIVAHEYFHNWTGNRITCRDWFQLCLKEGLTVFRDQQFSADERSAAVQRISDVKQLRARQFREDEGPLAHPVRPEEYIEINNFYTATVYEKGAEVIGMLHTLVGPEGYRKALDLYFERHDGQACTIEQFRACFEDACGLDLAQFALWWGQAGTPRVEASETWDGETLTLTLAQHLPPTPGQEEKQAMVIPVAVGALGPSGQEIAPTQVLTLAAPKEHYRLRRGPSGWVWDETDRPGEETGAEGRPMLSINRGFSAPVMLERKLTEADRAFLLAHDTDPFNRWEAGRELAIEIAHQVMDGGAVPEVWTDGLARVLEDPGLDPAFKALILDVPGEDELAGDLASREIPVDPDPIHAAVRTMCETLGERLSEPLRAAHDSHEVPGAYTPDAESAGNRALRNRAMALLAAGGEEGQGLARQRFETADNMTDQMASLVALVHNGAEGAEAALNAFFDQWHEDTLVLDKWLSLQAMNPRPGAVARVEALTQHAAFNWRNPNKFRSVIGVFAMANPTGFHAADGSGYRFVADWLIRLDPVNPQTTARLAGVFETWKRYEAGRQAKMGDEIERILATKDLSRNTTEILTRIAAR
ncbi:MAG: aminopeptidase N [Pseudomonadota bacterium]